MGNCGGGEEKPPARSSRRPQSAERGGLKKAGSAERTLSGGVRVREEVSVLSSSKRTTNSISATLPDEDLQAAGGVGLIAPAQFRDDAEDAEAMSPHRVRLQFNVDAHCALAHCIAGVISRDRHPEAHAAARKLGVVNIGSKEDLLELLLRAGHTSQARREDKELVRGVYDNEKDLETLLFKRVNKPSSSPKGAVVGDLELREEIVVLLCRWGLSKPRAMDEEEDDDEMGSAPPSPKSLPTNAGAVARKLLQCISQKDRRDIGYFMKNGFRRATRSFIRRVLDRQKERSIRREQELRRQSWWQELEVKRRVNGSLAAESPDAFHQWRRKSISDNVDLLPAQPPPQSGEKPPYTVVLDLDETLIYTRGTGMHLSARPGVPEFLRRLRDLKLDVVVWTASTKDYSAAILANIDPELQYVSECVYRHPKWFSTNGMRGHPRKDLALLGRDMDYTLIVDNSIDCIIGYSETNAVLVEDFRGVDVDDTLPSLTEFFEALAESEMTVPDYLKECGHYHFRPEYRVPKEGPRIQCFVLDPRPSFKISGSRVLLLPAPELAVIPDPVD
eukprot:Hpha_TRINITY_DN15912_c4_g5::TRINITY_DN15912_c4_g5_i1::g.70917::m.70917/K17616/CTDSPL2; CTD small phosphatase-like protein 2